jgi:tRNA modification GTPase
MTGKGTGAISTIQLYGSKAESVIEKIFRPTGSKKAEFKVGSIIVGTIYEGDEIIDQVTIGFEGEKNFAINCHGNPLIVADISRLLGKHKVKIVSAEKFLQTIFKKQGLTGIEIEAKIAQGRAKTIAGTKVILNQSSTGLSAKVQDWLEKIKTETIKQIQAEAEQILEDTRLAKLFIDGAQIVITGPANSGKSTLLNYLAGRQKSIVTEIAGTTIDYVTAECRLGEFFCELIDTAGLDEGQRTEDGRQKAIEKIAQKKSMEILHDADLVLLVLDRSGEIEQLDEKIVDKISGKKALTVLNKADLPSKLNIFKLPRQLRTCITISAKTGEGVENLISRISQLLGAAGFDLQSTVCFTNRQEKIISKIANAKSKQEIIKLITELLNGRL